MATHAHADGPAEDEVFDLDAVAHEIEDKGFRFTLKGEQYCMKHPKGIDSKALRMMEVSLSDNASEVEVITQNLKLLLGPEQFERFDKHDLMLGQLGALMERYEAHFGTELPESDASPRSSKKKARR